MLLHQVTSRVRCAGADGGALRVRRQDTGGVDWTEVGEQGTGTKTWMEKTESQRQYLEMRGKIE